MGSTTTIQVPFEEAGFMELVMRVGCNGETPPLPPTCPRRYASLLRACWQRDPSKRPSALRVVDTLRAIQEDLEEAMAQEACASALDRTGGDSARGSGGAEAARPFSPGVGVGGERGGIRGSLESAGSRADSQSSEH
jgi:hypothetical protein